MEEWVNEWMDGGWMNGWRSWRMEGWQPLVMSHIGHVSRFRNALCYYYYISSSFSNLFYMLGP